MDKLLGQDLIVKLATIRISFQTEQSSVNHIDQHAALHDAADLFLKFLEVNIWGEVFQIAEAGVGVPISKLPCVFVQLLSSLTENPYHISVYFQDQLYPMVCQLTVKSKGGHLFLTLLDSDGSLSSRYITPPRVRWSANKTHNIKLRYFLGVVRRSCNRGPDHARLQQIMSFQSNLNGLFGHLEDLSHLRN